MKAIDILKWVAYIGTESENFNVIEIDEDFDFESFFGFNHEPVESGNYFFYYSDSIEYSEMKVPQNYRCYEFETFKPTFSIDIKSYDYYGEKVFIHFYKIDD